MISQQQQDLILVSDDLKNVSIELLKEFGSVGKLLKNDNTTDPISGFISGVSSEIEVTYFREFFESKELVENMILSGDAKILFVLDEEPMANWSFIDSDLVVWNLVSPPVPTEAQGLKIAYEGHIRK